MPYHLDRKSTRLNSSHTIISYAVFCLKKKNRHYSEGNHKLRTILPRRRLPLPPRRDDPPPSRTLQETPGAQDERVRVLLFFFKERAPPDIYPLPLHAPLPI